MKTLIINGSPRKNGDTTSLIEVFVNHLDGEYKIIDTYYCNIGPCIDCRYCWKNEGCSSKDGWTELHKYILECDNVVIASPIYFSELTGELLSKMSKLQAYWAARFYRKEEIIKKKKKGGIILVGGNDGSNEIPTETAKCLLDHMNANDIFDVVCSHNTDVVTAIDDEEAVGGAKKLANFFNEVTA